MLTFEPASWRRSERSARLVLGRGSIIAHEVACKLDDFSSCWLIDPFSDRTVDPGLDGLSIDQEADACFGTFVGSLPGVRSVLVEDGDVSNGEHPIGNNVFIDAFALRWADISSGLLEASRLLRQDARGVPLCGYLCEREAADLRLGPGADLTVPQVATVIDSIRAVLVPVFGSEVNVAFCRPE